MKLDQVLATWKDYATVKKWKKSLQFGSNSGRLSENTDNACNQYMPQFIEFKQKNPDEIIEEALAGKFVVKESLSDFCNWLQDNKGMKPNQAITASYEIIRGFYSHNEINTQKIKTPVKDPSGVQTSDDYLPFFDIVEIERDDGKKEKIKKIRRDFLTRFLDLMPFRDKVAIMCVKDTGADDGDVLDWTLQMVRYQEPNQERIFIRLLRKKTKRYVCYFLTKETTALVRQYEQQYRKYAHDDEPLFVQTESQFKAKFCEIHGRPFDKDKDELKLESIYPHTLADSSRAAAKKLEKMLRDEGKGIKIIRKGTQSPLRPKRWRKVFSDACDYAGITTDIKRLFMGKKDDSNKTYVGSSRQDLELYFERIEPIITLYSDPDPIPTMEVQKLRQQIEIERQERIRSDLKTEKEMQKVAEKVYDIVEKKLNKKGLKISDL